MMGVASGGFERIFQQMGAPADTIDPDSPPFVPDFPRMQAAARPTEWSSDRTSPGRMPEDALAPAVPWPPPAHALPLPAARPAAGGSGDRWGGVRGDPADPATGARPLPAGRSVRSCSCCGLPARRRLATRQPAQRRAPVRRMVANPFERWRRLGSRSPVSTTG